MYESPDTSAAIKCIKESAKLDFILKIRLSLAKDIANCQQKLYEYRRTALIPKGKDFTELDRTVNMNADTALLEHDLLFLNKLDELLKDKFKILRQDSTDQ